ncbi:MAG: 2-dehydropantoate 2-reductase [Rubrivivax sp.]|nr:2-dehydropantoate 2-reductase [Rubrivivax sp.]
MKVAVVGMGAIGGLFAAWLGSRLPAGRVQLSALARGATLAALQRDGLQWQDAGAEPRPVALNASDDAAALGVQDLVIVAVKSPALAAVAPALRQLCGPDTAVLVAMNGVPWWFFDGLGGACDGLRLHSADPGGLIQAALPTARVIGCVVHVSSAAPAPGQVRHVNGNRLILGEPAGGGSDRVDQVAGLLEGAGFAVTVSERIQRDIWFKLWGNMTMNPVSALTGAPSDRILDDPLVRAFCSAVMLEAQAVGAAIGIPIDQAPEQRHAVTRKLGSFKTSMLQDVEAGRPLEIDALVGTVREIGQKVGVATPNVDALLGLVRLMAQQRGLYPR